MPWAGKLSLRHKITYVIMINTFAALCVASIAFAEYGVYRFKQMQMQDLNTLANVMASVSEFRILSAAGGPTEHGDLIASTLGVDQIRAATVPGDANHDNTVNFNDLLTLAQHYGQSNAHWEDGDFNFDGMVNFNDLLALAQNYGSSVSFSPPAAGVAAVPEPAMVLPLTVLTLLASARFTRRLSP